MGRVSAYEILLGFGLGLVKLGVGQNGFGSSKILGWVQARPIPTYYVCNDESINLIKL